ncbi:MAG TPA: TlpA disulfide reductase family protein [Steroidobacteraceae bacterium]|nr:TlpA disulfide reductase family protein [Steroidobacteraceae bacterium]
MRPLIRVLGTLLLVLCGILAGFLGYRTLHRPTLIAQLTPAAPLPPTNTPQPAQAPATAVPAAAASIPETLPDVQIPDLNGQPRSLRDYLGHPLVVNFWATWCEPCRREMPLLQQLWQQHRAQGIAVLGVAVDSRSAVQQYLHATPVGYPILADEDKGSAAVARFGIEPVLPFSVFTDAQGRIVAVKVGELHRDEAEAILAHLQQVTLGRESLPDARREIAAQLHALAIQRAKEAVQP